jgi:hypothetical protein
MIGRHYLVRMSGGGLCDLPRRDFDGAEDGTAPLPGFAGRCVDLVTVLLDYRPRGERVLTAVEFTKVYFDQNGFIDPAMRERHIRLMLESCADARPGGEPRLLWREAELVGVVASPGLPVMSDSFRARPQPEPQVLTAVAGTARTRLDAEFNWRPDPSIWHQVLRRYGPPPAATMPAGHTVH